MFRHGLTCLLFALAIPSAPGCITFFGIGLIGSDDRKRAIRADLNGCADLG
jgi:hypothetical protein